MFCEYCGQKIADDSKFCEYCGAKIVYSHPGGQAPAPSKEKKTPNQNRKSPRKKKSTKKPVIAAVAAAAVLLVTFLGYGTVGLAMSKNSLASKIEDSEIPEYVEQKEELLDEWEDLGITDVSDKREILKQLKDIKSDVDVFEDCAEQLKALESKKENYNLDEAGYRAYADALENCREAIDEKQASDAIALFDDANDALDALIQANDTYIEERMDLYESLDLSDAEEDVKSGYDENMKTIKSLNGSEESKDYAAYKEAFAKMDETIYMYIDPENVLNVAVQQIDASEFPKVKLYLNIKDPATGEVPEDLEGPFFYIKKEDANAQYVKQVVSNVNQLNEEEALKIDMVADVSGSMSGSPLREAKDIMSNFVNSVQFDAGDMVELTSFSTGVRLEEEFTDDASLLISDINNLATDDMTSLYDALYTAVGRVAAQTGARCVIAFTDGNDNYSSCSVDDVISIANRYHIPVFIIGIGSIDYSSVAQIAEQTGGAYYSINDVNSMQSIYDEIYRMEKELYLLEYEDNSGAEITDTANIQVGYRSPEYGGECTYSYTPNTLISVEATTLYTDGPEAVVEKYMKNFDDAMTHSDFSFIEDCLLPGSSIYQEQQAYVQRGISEQLDSYEIVSTDYRDADHCVVTTRETYYVQIKNEPLQLMTQQCQYEVTKSGNDWKMSAFAGQVEVLSRINQ